MTAFTSRWIEQPPHVRDADDPERLPKGFRASGVAAGIKPEGLDLGLIVCDVPDAVSAARFTRSAVQAAPVQVTRERADLSALRCVAANSGNANAATGRPGLDEAARMQGAAGMACGVPETNVAVCSTGVIGVQLDGHTMIKGLLNARSHLDEDGAVDFAHAIRTTDANDKHLAQEVDLPGGTVRLTAQAKGAGMIQPSFATMLCFVQTDAKLSAETADLLLGVCVKRSFDRISVDGQLSTNDTAILMASGASGVAVEPESEAEMRFGEALDALLRRLALLMVRDGEGARRVGRVVVRGGDDAAVERVARAVANSPLVKTAIHGGDPNWGRIAQAVGQAMPLTGTASLAFDVRIDGTLVCSAGAATREQAVFEGDEVEIEVTLPGRAPRPRSSSATSATSTSPSTRTTRRDAAVGLHHVGRDAPRGAPVHPRVPRPHDRHQVRRRRDGGPEAARGLRARRGAALVRRPQPDRRPRRRPRDHRLHEEARPPRRVRRRPARQRRRHRRGGQDGPRRQGQQGHRRAHQPPRPAGGRPERRRRPALPRVARRAPGGEDIGFVGTIDRVDVDVIQHIASDYIPVIASVANDREGNSYNVNADEAAAAVARRSARRR
jgi:glutamate N-acetyltransferase/amino-acid N-acetyltransferase